GNDGNKNVLTLVGSDFTFANGRVAATLGLPQDFEKAVLYGSEVNSTFGGQIAFVADVPQWISQGPAPMNDDGNHGSAVNIPNEPASGAIQGVAVDPRDPKSLFVATVDGGVWKNSDRTIYFKANESTLD